MACDGASPSCNSDNTCTESCKTDADCTDSGACLADGSCAETNRVLYVTADAATGDCSKANKCELTKALTLVDATKNVIHLDPLTYTFAQGFMLTGTFTLTGLGAILHVGAGQEVFFISGGNDVTIDFIEFGGVAGGARPDEAIDCVNATLTLRKVTISNLAGIGINSSGCGFRMERSIVHDAQLGGVQIGGGTPFAIFDNIIHHNGDFAAQSTLGGIRLLGSTGNGSRLEFNTIVDNASGPNGVAPNAGGVACSTQAMLAAANNIIARNASNGATSDTTQTAGPCTFPTSITTADVTALKFASPDTAPLSYKLTAGSSAIDQATTPSTVKIDFEDEARPQGSASDIGADELQ